MSQQNIDQEKRIINLFDQRSALMRAQHNVYALTSAFHVRLSAELRCNTYDYMLDEETTTHLTRELAIRTSHYFALRQIIHTWRQVPEAEDATLDFASMDQRVACEIVERFYEKVTHNGLSVQQLPTYLEADLFEVGVRPCDAVLSAVDMHIDLDDTDISLNQWLFEPLLRPEQKWARGFKLNLSLHMRLPGYAAPPNVGSVLEALRAFDGVVRDAEMKSVGAEVHIALVDSSPLGLPPLTMKDAHALSKACSKEEFEAEWLRVRKDYERNYMLHSYQCHCPIPTGPYPS